MLEQLLDGRDVGNIYDERQRLRRTDERGYKAPVDSNFEDVVRGFPFWHNCKFRWRGVVAQRHLHHFAMNPRALIGVDQIEAVWYFVRSFI